MKRWAKIGLALGIAGMAVLVTLFFFIDVNAFRPLLQTQLSNALGRQVQLGNLHFAPFSGGVVANNLAVADDSAYGTSPFLTAKELRIGVEMASLIFSHRLQVRSLEIDQPQIRLIRGANGNWNFSSIGRTAASRTGNAKQESVIPNLTIGKLQIRDGKAVIEDRAAQGPARIYDHLNLSARQFSFTRRVPFTVSAGLPADGTVSANGTIGPVDPTDAALTAFDVQISIHHLDPVAAGFLDPSVGVSMLADIDAHANSDGRIVHSAGTVHMQRLQLGKASQPAPKPVDLRYAVTQNLQDKNGQLQRADVHVGNVAIAVDGVYRLDPGNPWLNVRLAGQNLPIDELQSLMTAAGVKLPNGAVLRGGSLTLALAITGPANDLTISGPIALANTRLVGFNLGSKISGIAALGGVKTGDTTALQNLNLNLQETQAGIKIGNINAVVPALGAAQGSGTVSPAGVLSFHLVAQVTTSKGLGKLGVGLLTKLNSISTAKTAAASGVPIRVTGTVNDPVITADVDGLMKRNVDSIGGKIKRLFAGSKS